MNRFARLAAVTLMAVAPAAAATTAHAVAPNFPTAAVRAINWDGFKTCKALGDSGYTAVIRGILGDGGGHYRATGFHPFNIKTCFETRAGCEHFLSRIHHKVSQIEQINYRGCSLRG